MDFGCGSAALCPPRLNFDNTLNKQRRFKMKKAAYPVQKKNQARPSMDGKGALGLCSSCQSGADCTYNRDPRLPILQCEEFEGIVPSPVEMIVPRNIPLTKFRKNPLPPHDPFQNYKGLCSTCEERATCIYPKPEGGVWHCEEYR